MFFHPHSSFYRWRTDVYTSLAIKPLFSGVWVVQAGSCRASRATRALWGEDECRIILQHQSLNQQRLQHHPSVPLQHFLALGWVLQRHLQLVLRRQRSICYYMSRNQARAVPALGASWRHVHSFSNSRFASSPFHPALLSDTCGIHFPFA